MLVYNFKMSWVIGAVLSLLLGFFLWYTDEVSSKRLLEGFSIEDANAHNRHEMDMSVLTLLGKTAPVFRLTNPDGKVVDIGEHKGLSLLIFIDSESSRCDSLIAILSRESLAPLGREYELVKKLIITDGNYLESQIGAFTVLQDSVRSVSRSYNIEKTPLLYMVNWPDGYIINGASNLTGIIQFLEDYSNPH